MCNDVTFEKKINITVVAVYNHDEVVVNPIVEAVLLVC